MFGKSKSPNGNRTCPAETVTTKFWTATRSSSPGTLLPFRCHAAYMRVLEPEQWNQRGREEVGREKKSTWRVPHGAQVDRQLAAGGEPHFNCRAASLTRRLAAAWLLAWPRNRTDVVQPRRWLVVARANCIHGRAYRSMDRHLAAVAAFVLPWSRSAGVIELESRMNFTRYVAGYSTIDPSVNCYLWRTAMYFVNSMRLSCSFCRFCYFSFRWHRFVRIFLFFQEVIEICCRSKVVLGIVRIVYEKCKVIYI